VDEMLPDGPNPRGSDVVIEPDRLTGVLARRAIEKKQVVRGIDRQLASRQTW
jgi:hypothetical protein